MSESINTLIGTFSSFDNIAVQQIESNSLICIDTSSNRLGINTIDPSYSIHVVNSTDLSGIISCPRLIISSIKQTNDTDTNLLLYEVYHDASGFLKIKLPLP